MNIQKGSKNRPESKPRKIDLKSPNNNVKSPKTTTVKSPITITKGAAAASANPFLIDLVLIKIFGYVKKKDLPACRLVCTKWNLMVIPRFREAFEIYLCTIDHSIPFSKYTYFAQEDCKPGENHKSLESFVKLMCTSICIPFTKFRLDLNGRAKCRTEFFKVCGPIITHVTLRNFTYEGRPSSILSSYPECALIENLNGMFKFSRNLKCLRFHTPVYYMEKEPGYKFFDGPPSLKTLSFHGYEWPSAPIEELIAHSPNLVDICATDMWMDAGPHVLSTLLSTDRLSTIQNLTTEAYRIQKGFVDQVEKCGLKLKKLHIIGYDFNDPQHLYRLIELQKDNLQEFNCNLWTFNTTVPSGTGLEPELPGMKNVKDLSIRLEGSLVFSMRCDKQPFCEKFPNVEIISYYYGYDEMNLDFLGSQCCPKLKSMELDFYSLHLPGFQNMTVIYSTSALTSLKLDTGHFSNPEILKLIWTNLTNLQEFELVFHMEDFKGDLDSIFTGISTENCKEIKKNPADYWNFMKTNGKKNKSALAELAHELCVSPSITNLKSLRRLSLQCPGIGLTDITGYVGLYALENIKHIHIDFCEFSKSCCESLLNQLNLESWVFREKTKIPPVTTFGFGRPGRPGPFGKDKKRTGPNNDIVQPYFYPYTRKGNI